MLLVVDTNVILSALISRKGNLRLLCSRDLVLISPEFTLVELESHFDEIYIQSGLSKKDLYSAFQFVFKKIRLVEMHEYSAFKDEALRFAPDLEDWPFFALAVKEGCGLWSNETRLKKQKFVRVYSTSEVANMLDFL